MNSIVLWLYRIVTRWLPESRAFGFKAMLLRFAGAKIGNNVRIYSSASFLGTGGLEFGDDVHIGPSALFAATAPAVIKIGSHVDIGPGVVVTTGTHAIDPSGPHIGGCGETHSTGPPP